MNEYREQITGFIPLEDDVSHGVKVLNPSGFSVGSPQVFAFAFSAEGALVGTYEYMKALFIERGVDDLPAAVALQAASLFSDEDKEQAARRRYGRALQRFGASSVRAFGRSAATASLWRDLLRSAKDEAAAHRFLESRGELTVTLDEQDNVNFDLSAIDVAADHPTFSFERTRDRVRAEYLELSVPETDPAVLLDESAIPDPDMDARELRTFLDQRLGPDGRIGQSTYWSSAEVLKRMGIQHVSDLSPLVNRQNADMLEHLAIGSRQGQMTRFELLLAYVYGSRFYSAYSAMYGHYWPNRIQDHLARAQERAVQSYNGLTLDRLLAYETT